MTTISDPSAMTPDDPRWLSWFMQQRRFDRLSRKAQTGASLITDFASGVYEMGYPGQRRGSYELSDIVKVSRSTGGGRVNSSGVYEWVGNDVPRLTHNPVTLQPLGLLVEEQRTNLLVNSVLDGAVVGVLGSGGALPTGWELEAAAGLATSVIATGVESGRRYVDIRINGNQNGSFWQLRTNNFATGTAGQSYTSQVTARLLSGSMPNGFRLNTVEATGSFDGTGTTAQLSASYTTLSASRLVALASASMQTRIQHTAYTGAVDCTFRITAPQAELGATPSSYIPTTTTQVTRAADVAAVNTLAPWYNALEGTLVIVANTGAGATPHYASFLTSTGSSYEGLRAFRQTSIGTDRLAFRDAGGPDVIINSADITSKKRAVSYKAGGDVAICADGGAVSKASIAAESTPAITRLFIGSRNGGELLLNGTIASIEYYPSVIDVQQASA